MYRPPAFREDDFKAQLALIEAHPLGLLISQGANGIIADPIPFLLYPEEGEHGVLRCHVAKANPQWQALTERPEALVIFQGVDHYVSPAWYPSKAEHGKVVPTWNYEIVEARGKAVVFHDAAWLLANVTALSDLQESRRPKPWAVGDAPDDFIASQLKGIVGIEVPIDTLVGKVKASQNRPAADRQGVAAGLAELGDARARAMLDLVKSRGGA